MSNAIAGKDFAEIVTFLNNHPAFIWDKQQSLWRSVNYEDRNAEIKILPHGFEVFLFIDAPSDTEDDAIEITTIIFNLNMLQGFI